MSTDLLGEGFKQQFQGCGHKPLDDHGARVVLQQFEGGGREQIKSALHTMAGHATQALVPTLSQHRENLRDVASALKNGTFEVADLGSLIAGGQYQTARVGLQAGQAVADASIIAVYQEALGSERARSDGNFRSWMVGTTLAALRMSTRPQAGVELLKSIVGDLSLRNELLSNSPSQLRYVVIVAAPSLCMPQLFDVYGPAIMYGSAEERGAALLHVAQVPAIKAVLRGQGKVLPDSIINRAQQWVEALEFALDVPGVGFLIPPNKENQTKTSATRSQVEGVVSALRATVGGGQSASHGAVSRSGVVTGAAAPRNGSSSAVNNSGDAHVCGASCALHNKNLISV
jgi:hypothetical protein